MGKYTLELREILQDPKFNLFDFDYKFYLDDKRNFEESFIATYYYSEIGFETVHRFKQKLKTKLDMIYPYYVQLYDTELKSKDISFLLNKDLEESYIKNISNDMITNSENNSLYKESNIDNGNADVELSTNNLTNVNNTQDNLNGNVNNQGKEEFKLTSKGNIGTTSSATLLKEWRNVLININEMIVDECKDLFMGVF